jgi:hypothetical protein
MGALGEGDREDDPEDGEARRRRMLAESDRLLDRVERLRLMEQHLLPAALSTAICSLQTVAGRAGGVQPRTVNAAQQLLFSVQQRLMAANPRNPQPLAHPGRAAGASRVAHIGSGGVTWRFLSLPAPGGSRSEAEWRERVELTVERALDRWSYVQGRAVAAARARRPDALRELARARAAWSNYWELRCEAQRVLATPKPDRACDRGVGMAS